MCLLGNIQIRQFVILKQFVRIVNCCNGLKSAKVILNIHLTMQREIRFSILTLLIVR